jgi:calcineurin-like phosphoesterase family protein
MANIFFISDTHFGHEAPCTKFKRADGSPLRDFVNAAACDEYQVEQWNKTVSPKDKVYHLGDVTMSKKFLHILDRLNGDKVLIKGNHDLEDLKEYSKYFYDVRGSHQFDGILLTHIPVHPDSLSRWGFNVHGHLHARRVMTAFGTKIDPRYFCVSVEQLDYTPISLEDVKAFKPALELPPRTRV